MRREQFVFIHEMISSSMFIPLLGRQYGVQLCIQTRCWTPFFDSIHASSSPTLVVSHWLNHSDGAAVKARYNFQVARMIGNGGIPCMRLGCRFSSVLWYSSRSYRRRENRRIRLRNQPMLDEARFNKAVSELPPRFTAEDLHDAIVLQDDPLVCLELFNWASQQPRFRHGVCSFHVTIKKLGAAKMYKEMDDVVNQVLAIRHLGSEALSNTMIYYFTEARKLTRAVYIFKHMKNSKNLECRPSIRTYNLLFTAFLSRRTDTHVNHMYMETMRCLFRQLVDDGLEPDIYALNSMIKGYVLSNHVNDALRLFHQMGVVYTCLPNAVSYDHLIHGLCAQGRTNNARELVKKMKEKGFVPNSRTYNSLVNSLSITGEIEEAVLYLREMSLAGRLIDFITYRTLLDELCRRGDAQKAMKLLLEFRKEGIVDELSYDQLLSVLQDDFRWSASENNASIARL